MVMMMVKRPLPTFDPFLCLLFVLSISDACKESSWKTHSDMVQCTERIDFTCTGMFPKPSPMCGIYNDLTGQYFVGERLGKKKAKYLEAMSSISGM